MAPDRRLCIVGNWKMHATINEARTLAKHIRDGVGPSPSVEVVLAPPFTALAVVGETLTGCPPKLAAQTMHQANAGAYTGEISPVMLRDVGCDYVILGHSERRQLFGESDALVAMKTKAALAHDLRPIVCVGETLEQQEAGETKAVIARQLGAVTHVVSTPTIEALGTPEAVVVAYEPVWAIGTGKTASPETAQGAHAFIRGLWAEAYGRKAADGMRILYGGSVKPENAAALLVQPDIDGALVGGASLTAETFIAIVRAGEEAPG